MEDLKDLGLEDIEALGLRIEKCVDEVLRSHLVERSLNTTKNYVPKQKEWKVNQAPPLQPFPNVHRLNHRPGVRRSAFVLATPATSRTTGSTRASYYSSLPSRS
jgi:hypothetical protein